MAKLYFRYGEGKSSNLCQTAYNYNEMGMKVITMNASNEDIKSSGVINGKPIFERKIDYIIDGNIYEDMKEHDDIKCILVDNAHLLSEDHVFELFLVANDLNITVITYGNRGYVGSMRLMELANIIEPVDEVISKSKSGLEFYYGAMNASKTAKLLYKYHLMKNDGESVVLIKPKLDRDANKVISRIGLEAKADIVLDKDDDVILENDIDYALVDEAQFLTKEQIDRLKLYSMYKGIRCYGLRNDFKTKCFEGAGRLLEVSDKIVKMKTICSCGDGAEFNARTDLEGNFLTEGDSIAIDDGETVKYEPLCPKCYVEKVLKIKR